MMMHRVARTFRRFAGRRHAVGRNAFNRIAAAAPALLAAALATGLQGATPSAAGVRYGDAVPGIVRASDLEILKGRLRLDRFSVIAAVRLGSLDGRELIIAEPLSEEALALVEASCAGDRFCPDPYGFVAARVRIVHLRDRDVATVVTIDRETRDRHGRIFSLQSFDLPGRLIGWNGHAEAASGHVALVLTPIVQVDDDPVRAGDSIPFTLMWDEAGERFALWECTTDEDDVETCAFYRDEPENDR